MRHVRNCSVNILFYCFAVLGFIEREIELLQFEEVAGLFYILL